MKNIGILGSGIVATPLAEGFIKHGYKVLLGTSHPDKLNDWKAKQGKGANIGSFDDADQFGDLMVFPDKWSAAMDVLESAGKENLKGKTIIDTTNPIEAAP